MCYGLNKAHIDDCESAVDRCSLYEDHKDVIRCGGRELLKECAGLKDEPLTLCVERFVDYTCKNQKKKGKDKRDCKLETMEMALARLDMEKKRPKAYGPYWWRQGRIAELRIQGPIPLRILKLGLSLLSLIFIRKVKIYPNFSNGYKIKLRYLYFHSFWLEKLRFILTFLMEMREKLG